MYEYKHLVSTILVKELLITGFAKWYQNLLLISAEEGHNILAVGQGS
jgi:hypothetical protein